MENLFVNNVWPTLALGVIAYTAGYFLGVLEIYLYQIGANEHIVFEGGYELAPQFLESIARRRFLTPRFLIALPILAVAIWAVWDIVVQQYKRPEVFLFLLGGLALLEAAVSIQYLRNIVLFQHARNSAGVRGQVEYSKRLVHTLFFIELYSFAGLYLLMFLWTGSWFFMGGSLACFVTASRRRDWTLVYS